MAETTPRPTPRHPDKRRSLVGAADALLEALGLSVSAQRLETLDKRDRKRLVVISCARFTA
jgi:hypothetical protein